MKIRVLGSSSGEPVPQRNASAYLLESGSLKVLIDAGDGVSKQIIRYHIDPCLINSVLISHTHPDHAGGLVLLLQQMYISKRKKPLVIYIPGGVLPGFQDIFPYFNIFKEKWPFTFELKPIMEGLVFKDHQIQIEAVKNGHVSQYQQYASRHGITAESFSFAFTDVNGRKLVYTADIDEIQYLRSAAVNTHILLSECTHIKPDHIIHFAMRLNIDRVIFTHIPPELETSIYTIQSPVIDVSAVKDGDVIEV
ncbi:ribonuclease Z [bacterium]|nr:ribonuclease Z [bacterium]